MKYNIVILDEAHERSIYTDILFALVKAAVKKRNGSLKLIVTSATLNTDMFSKYFDNCPVLKMEGKCYPVDVKYHHTPANLRVEEAVKNAIRLHLHEGLGHILVFLTGSEECEQAVKRTHEILEDLISKGKEVPSALIFSLYGAQSSEDQHKVFESVDEDTRKIVYSTNIAETSITIDGVGFVIDSGHVKQKQYNPKTGMDCLMVVPISKVQAVQRMGRAGRTMEGKCLRMYSEKFFNEQMENTTMPEILRVNLTSLILTLKCIGIDDVLQFDYMERPDDDLIIEALKQLHILNAIEEDGKVNDFGREMCKLPMEPHFSKSLLISKYLDCQDDVLTVVALLSSEKLFVSVSRGHVERHQQFLDTLPKLMMKEGDHATMNRIFKEWKREGRSDRYARNNFINARALHQAENIRGQIGDLISTINYKIVEKFLSADHIYKLSKTISLKDYSRNERLAMSLCSSFFFNAARRVHTMSEDYLLISEGNMVNLDPSCAFSVLHTFPEYLIFSELAGNSAAKGLMRTATAVREDWIMPYTKLLKQIKAERLAKADAARVTHQEMVRTVLNKVEAVRAVNREDKVALAKEKYLQRVQVREKIFTQNAPVPCGGANMLGKSANPQPPLQSSTPGLNAVKKIKF